MSDLFVILVMTMGHAPLLYYDFQNMKTSNILSQTLEFKDKH